MDGGGETSTAKAETDEAVSASEQKRTDDTTGLGRLIWLGVRIAEGLC